MPAFVIRATVSGPAATRFTFEGARTMYGGKAITAGDTAYLFAGRPRGGADLLARGRVLSAALLPRTAGGARETPRVTVILRRTALARRPLGDADLAAFRDWDDGRPETELNFRFFRQATEKVGGISDETAAFLDGFF